MWIRIPHLIMGRFYGMFYEEPSGRRLYLAHRKRSQIYFLKYAWCLDISTLDKCREQGVTAIGIRWKDKGKKYTHLTHIDDFFGPHSFFHFGETKQRGLPLKHFRVDPAKCAKVIGSAVKLR